MLKSAKSNKQKKTCGNCFIVLTPLSIKCFHKQVVYFTTNISKGSIVHKNNKIKIHTNISKVYI